MKMMKANMEQEMAMHFQQQQAAQARHARAAGVGRHLVVERLRERLDPMVRDLVVTQVERAQPRAVGEHHLGKQPDYSFGKLGWGPGHRSRGLECSVRRTQ